MATTQKLLPMATPKWQTVSSRRRYPGHTRNGPVQDRPDDLDSLQQLPSDSEDEEHATQNRINEPMGSLSRLPKSWQPLWLRRTTLITMAANQGLGSTSSTDGIVYLWKYLPTTVIVILLAVWNGIDFSSRWLQPWANLRSGPGTAESTVLLDLLTPMLPVMIWTASKLKAWPSLLTIAAVLVLNIITTSVVDWFDVTGWDPEMNDNVTATVYYGVWAQKLPWPEWTFQNATLEPLLPPETVEAGSATSYSGTTRGFFPGIECAEPRIDGDLRITSNYTYIASITFKAPSCSDDVDLPLLDSNQVSTWRAMHKNPDRSFVGTSKLITCPDQTQRYFASVTLVDSNMKLLRSSSLFCRPSYSVQNVTVQVAPPDSKTRVDWSTFELGSAQVEGLGPMNLLSNIVNSTRMANLPLMKQPNKTAVNNDLFLRAASVSLLRDDMDTIYLEPFLDAKVLADHIRDAFSGMASIAVHTRMLSTAQELILGTAAHDESRVRVPAGAALSICGLLVLGLLLSFLLLALRTRGVVPRDPRSIGGIGAIFRNSHELQRRCGSGLSRLKQSIRDARISSYVLAGARPKFLVNIEDHFRTEKRKGSTAAPDKIQEAWQPIVLTNCAAARRGVLSRNLGRLPLITFFVSLREKHIAACFSAIGTILGSLLTILVAGLYSFASLDIETSMTVQRTDGFGNISYPQWTYDDLIFPNLTLSEADLGTADSTRRITVSVPARRAMLQCDTKKTEEVKVEIKKSSFDSTSTYTIHTELRSRCPGSTGKPIPTRIISTRSNLTGFGGQLGNLWETANITDGGPLYTNHPPPANQPGFHSLIFYYGSFPSEVSQSRASQKPSSRSGYHPVFTTARRGKSLGIDPGRAPVPDEGTARFVNAGTPEASNVQEYLVAYPLSNFFRPVTGDNAVLRDLQTFRGLDWFYQAVVLADGGMDPTDLVGSANAPRLVEATSKMYGHFMAQVMHRIMRSPGTILPSSQRTLPAVATQSQTRLRQNAGPKVALQLLLGLMAASAVAAWLAMRDTNFLPHEPGSIAGVAVLVAGSGLWGDGGDGDERNGSSSWDTPLVPGDAE
ncbi:hypothetical protein PG994_013518 [Apiospora phragmitis]|uniref:Transmembrane protein n=1 Tax=Apiospora phragmitis TaxID=2905665 RepID=A0ABR1T8W9_9PEZI